jgi:hypothetical protein
MGGDRRRRVKDARSARAIELLMLRTALVMISVSVFCAQAIAGECNPVIDGTYCATQPDSSLSNTPSPTHPQFDTIQGLGGDLSIGQAPTATFGAITFSGSGTRCIALLRQGACN